MWINFFFLFSTAASASEICKDVEPLGIPFTIEALLEAIPQRQVGSVEKALCLIPESAKQNYVLVRKSQSAQNGSELNPRVILFDKGKETQPIKWALSFNGDPEHFGFKNIEIMKFDVSKPVKDQIEFVDVKFIEGKAHISSPQLCLSCHQFQTSLPRPLWDSKTFFPTVYGQTSIGGTGVNNPSEAFSLREFIKHSESHPRYSQLVGLPGLFKYSCSKEEIDKKECYDSAEELVRRNDALAARLAHVNRRRIAELIRQTPDYDKYKYSIIASIFNCPRISEMLPEKIRKKHRGYHGVDPELLGKPLTQEQVNRSQKRMNQITNCGHCDTHLEFSQQRSQRNGTEDEIFPYVLDTEIGQGQWGQIDDEKVGRLRYLFEGRGISMAMWNMDLPLSQGFYRFQNGPSINGENRLFLDLPLLGVELVKSDKDLLNLRNRFSDLTDSESGETCRNLKAASLKAFSGSGASKTLTSKKTRGQR